MIDGKSYREYFETQAEEHPLLLHSEDNKVFALVTVEQAIGDLRSSLVSASGYLMRCIEPTSRLTPGDQYPRQTFDGGFTIARKYDVRNQGAQSYLDAMDGSEAVGWDIVEKMYADSAKDHPLFKHAAHSTLSVTARTRPVVGDGGYGGYLFLWSIQTHFCYNSPATRADWRDGGLTDVL
ncbi:MAG: hypothetical protein AAF597_17055 [Bacteroidota bacterium]